MELTPYLVTIQIVLSAVAARIIHGPTDITYPEGSDICLTCMADEEGIIRWSDIQGTEIFYGNTKETELPKYLNFEVNFTTGQSNMYIFNAEMDDEGFYVCQQRDEKISAYVAIEVQPVLKLITEGTEETSTPEVGLYPISITCTAYGARPNVSIQFKIGEKNWQLPSTLKVISRDMLFDTTANIRYTVPESTTNLTITCQTFGQNAIPEIMENIELYKPRCFLQIIDAEAECHCKAKPEVYKYILTIDKIQNVTARKQSLSNYPQSNVTCLGTSFIGTGTSNTVLFMKENGTNSYLFVVPVAIGFLIVTLCFVAFIYWQRRRKENTLDSESRYQLMSRYRLTAEEKNQLKTEFRELMTSLPKILHHDWEIFAVDILGMPVERVKEILEHHDNIDDQVKYVIEWIPADDFKYVKDLFYNRIQHKSKMCQDFGLILDKKEDRYHFIGVTPTTVGDLNDDGFIKLHEPTSKLYAVMTKCSRFIGPVGSNILTKEYDNEIQCKAPSDTLWYVRQLAEKMEEKMLFRARKYVIEYADYLDSVIIAIEKLGKDWEVFAIEVMELSVSKVTEIINKTPEENDQIMSAILAWGMSQDGEINKDMIERLIQEIDIYATTMMNSKEIDETGENKTVTTSNEDVEQFSCPTDALYQTVLVKCGEKFGEMGACKLLQEYSVPSQDSYKLLDVFDTLILFGKVKNNTESMTTLRNNLAKIGLLRASNVILYYNDVMKFKQKCLEEAMRDWEIYAIDTLTVPVNDVKNIVNKTDCVKDQIQKTLHVWKQINGTHENSEMMSLYIEQVGLIIQDEDLFNNLASQENHQESQEPSSETRKEDGQMSSQTTCNDPYTMCAKLIGREGTNRLFTKYQSFNNQMNKYSIESTTTGLTLFATLEELKLLVESNIATLCRLSEYLQECQLFRANKLVEIVIKNETEIEQILDAAATNINVDWEIFAVNDLKLNMEDVIEIIQNKQDVKDQVKQAMYKWYTRLPEHSKFQEKLSKIVKNSQVYKDQRNDASTQLTFTSVEFKDSLYRIDHGEDTYLSDDEYCNMLNEIGLLIGYTGALKTFHEYKIKKFNHHDIEDAMRSVNGPGYKMLEMLLNENCLRKDKTLITTFGERLANSHLYRAKTVLDSYLPKENRQTQHPRTQEITTSQTQGNATQTSEKS